MKSWKSDYQSDPIHTIVRSIVEIIGHTRKSGPI